MEENNSLEPYDIFSMSDEDFLKNKHLINTSKQEQNDVEDNLPKEKTKSVKKERDIFAEFQKPIKIGNKEIDISDPEKALDIIYNGVTSIEKLRSLKPQLIACKTLSEAGFDIENNAGYILDLLKGEPQAIEKLLFDHNIQPYTLKPFNGGAEHYIPKSELKSEATYDLSEYLETFATYSHGNEAIQYVNGLESTSIEHVVKNPQLLNVVRQAMVDGYHDEIVKRIEEGRLRGFNYGVNEIIHYLTIYEQAEQLNLNKPKLTPKQEVEEEEVLDYRVNDGRRNAGIQSNMSVEEYDELLDLVSMSDEEFLKKVKK